MFRCLPVVSTLQAEIRYFFPEKKKKKKNGRRLKRKRSLLKQQIVMIKRSTKSSLIFMSVFASLKNLLTHLNRIITLLIQFAILGL